jgi:hypothetical protein
MVILNNEGLGVAAPGLRLPMMWYSLIVVVAYEKGFRKKGKKKKKKKRKKKKEKRKRKTKLLQL